MQMRKAGQRQMELRTDRIEYKHHTTTAGALQSTAGVQERLKERLAAAEASVGASAAMLDSLGKAKQQEAERLVESIKALEMAFGDARMASGGASEHIMAQRAAALEDVKPSAQAQ